MTTNNQYSMWDEYDFGETKINPLAPYTYDKSCKIADGMTEKEMIKLGFDGEEDLWILLITITQLPNDITSGKQ